MPRPSKKKIIGKLPKYTKFYTDNQVKNNIFITLEEYEVIRLIDYNNLSQSECAKSMKISRSNVAGIYKSARNKLARFIIEGHNLYISGGEYIKEDKEKEVIKMKVAVTCVDGLVFEHFGHCPSFLVCDIDNNEIVKTEMIQTNGEGCGMIAGLLKLNNVDTLICGGIGGGAKNSIINAGIKLLPGASGDALKQVESFIQGNLEYDPNTECAGHDEGHEHNCGNHHKCH